ncbi:2-polyprenyl-6-methoxyphenol hydroxylase-like FAD-dependent oxidoreductase [Roseiarcus fermentans]|uniref:2-polyprenyl-6-methoxyphenol hydroxylase-like FAD-dependent oxidoreductase n=1 Tax=Roseiarcus fermentans TaxID=1473586 RepID=A0A366EVZ6_9HYPH|nr:FAD-dependent monooxygenase [Roseiarcus fermentans]RBP05689.1 2-polyprenyl-6-methoxyphenol hydroxylase-like FAD-dependent oxidoreductase [Roseiarcus fermentans]
MDASVLIVGAGPTGLVLALWLTKQGVPVRIIDQTAGPGATSRALAVQARTLELYRQLDLADAVVAKGYAVPGVRLWLGGREAARIPFAAIASDLTPYGFLHIFPQDEHERLLIERLAALRVAVERSTELLGYAEDGGRVSARLRGPDGAERTAEAAFIAGCDGAHSAVRAGSAVGYPGAAYPQTFYVADVAGAGPAFNGDLNIELDQSDFLAVFPLADGGRVRLIGAIRQDDGRDLDKLSFDDISDRAKRLLRLEVETVNWFSTYRISHRVADHFRRGRTFLLGDAAHIHTPVGGQGMNTGIGDAINLAWKLAAVLAGRAPDALLDSFEAERRAFALRLVQTTDRFFNVAAAEGRLAEIVRTRIAPIALPLAAKLEPARDYLFRTISQITLNYRGEGLAEGRAGAVHGGDRMPWVKAGAGDNHQALAAIGWSAHVYGAADDGLRQWSEARRVPLAVFPWEKPMGHAGLRENALYLIRPDTYVALAETAQSVDAVERFFARTQIRP